MTTATETNRQIITDALVKCGVVGMGNVASDEEIDNGRRALSRMLKSWQNKGFNLWATSSQSVTLTTAASYTLDPVRPLEILTCRLKRSGIETPMEQLTREEYDSLPLKTSTGLPTTFYYDRQREAARLYVWPVLAAAGGETLEITYTRELADVDLNAAVDVPTEWYDAVVYGLAARLADDYMVNSPNMVARAEQLLREALAYDREGSVFFVEPG